MISEADRVIRVNARRAVQRAVESGEISKPEICSVCGASGDIEGHHDDYSQPLSVRWLCHECHGLAHTAKSNVPKVGTTFFCPREVWIRLRNLATETGSSQQAIWIEALTCHLDQKEARA